MGELRGSGTDVIMHSQSLLRMECGAIVRGEVKSVHAYETMFLLNPSLSEEEYEAMIAKFGELIQSNGGEVTKTDRRGRRRLAYEIEDCSEAWDAIHYFNAPSELVAELERVYRITDAVIRYLIIRQDD